MRTSRISEQTSRLPLASAAVLTILAIHAALAAPPAYITNFDASTVTVIDTATNTPLGSPIPVGASPLQVVTTPDGTRGYVSNYGSNSVSVIDTSANVVIATISVGSSPAGLGVTPDGSRVYVANTLDGTLSVINVATNAITATIPVGGTPGFLAISPDGTRAYVGDLQYGTVIVLNLAANTVITRIPIGIESYGVAVTPDGSHVYVANPPGNNVSVIATATNTVQTTIATALSPLWVAITPDGTTAYVTALGETQFINTATNSITGSIAVGNESLGVVFTPDGSRAYITTEINNTNGGDVYLLDTTSQAVIDTIPVNGYPLGIAIASVRTVAFASLSPKLNLTVAQGVFNLNATFTPGAASTGINPVTQPVTLKIGPYSVTFPIGSFHLNPVGFVYSGVINGATLTVQITSLGGNQYSFKASSTGANLSGIANPVPVTLTIGNNAGTTSVTANIQ